MALGSSVFGDETFRLGLPQGLVLRTNQNSGMIILGMQEDVLSAQHCLVKVLERPWELGLSTWLQHEEQHRHLQPHP